MATQAVPVEGWTVPGAAAPKAYEAPGGPLDIAITIGGLLVATGLAVVLALIEVFLSPLHVSDLGISSGGSIRVPLSLLLAVGTNPLLGWFAYTTTGRQLATLLPAVAWCVVWVLGADRTTEGDLLLLPDNWVGMATLFAGPVTFAIGFYVSMIRQRVARPANSKATPLAP